MIDFERLFEQSKKRLEIQLNNKCIDEKILPYLSCNGQNISIDNLVKTFRNYLLIGDGGAGKTSTFITYWSKLCGKNLSNSKIVPLYIKASELENKEKYPKQTLIEYIKWNYSERETVSDPYVERSSFIRDITNNIQDYEIVLLIDAIDELKSKDVREKLWDDIECYMDNTSIHLLITSRIRERKVPASIVTIEVTALRKEQVNSYLQSKGIVRFEGVKINQLLFNPMFLTLYVYAYNEDTVLENLTEVELLETFFTTQLNKHDDDIIIFIIRMLLPIMCFLMFVDGENLGNLIHVRKIMEQALEICFNDSFLSCFISYGLEEARATLKQFDVERWLVEFYQKCSKIMNIVYFEDDYYNWKHTFFFDWFTCQGIILALKKKIIEEEKIFRIAGERIGKENSIDNRLDSLKICEYLYENCENQYYIPSCSKAYVLFLIKLTYLYDSLRQDQQACSLSKKTLEYLDKESVKHKFVDKVELANYINGVAYALVHLRDMETNIMVELNIYAKKQFDKALKIIEDDTSIDALKAKARIYGNIGAYYITVHKLSILMAKENHEKALEIRDELFARRYDEELQENKATSYTCLATDYFLMKEYGKAVKLHQKAIDYRIKEGNKVINYNREAGAMVCDILFHPLNSPYKIQDVFNLLAISLEVIETEREYGELKSWKETFFNSIELLSVAKCSEREEFKNIMEELIKRYDKLYSSLYIHVENYVDLFRFRVNNLNLRGENGE